MANSYTINDHNLVINVRSDFLTYGRAIGRFAHACREKNQTKHINYLNKNPATINRYKLLSEFNSNGNMRDANSKDDELHNIAFVKNFLKGFQESFEKDYTAQSYTQKQKGKDKLYVELGVKIWLAFVRLSSHLVQIGRKSQKKD